MVRKMRFNTKAERIDAIEQEEEDNGFFDGDIKTTGELISSFSFTDDPVPTKPNSISLPNTEREAYNIGRYYKLRYSTAKMLNEIKASHPDVNVYMNTIVDEAIRYYYNFSIKNGLSQHSDFR